MQKIVAVSPTLVGAVWRQRAAGIRQADIAKKAGLDPTIVSKIISGLIPVRAGDPRVLALARAVAVPSTDAFIVTRHGDS
jgi:hypothetical protein